MQITIAEERPNSEDAIQLIDELQSHSDALYPPESCHGFSVEKLVREGVAFFVARCDGAAAACGGIKMYGTGYGEVKRMYVRPAYRGLGLGKALLNRLAEHARERRVDLLRLETGVYQTEAIGLYERFGFERRPPFGEYTDDPLSVFYEKSISRLRRYQPGPLPSRTRHQVNSMIPRSSCLIFLVLASCMLVAPLISSPQSAFDGSMPGERRVVASVAFCWCPAGRFTMGSPPNEPERRPGEDQVEVTLSRGFWMAKYETTQGLWKRAIGALPGPLRRSCPRAMTTRLGTSILLNAGSSAGS